MPTWLIACGFGTTGYFGAATTYIFPIGIISGFTTEAQVQVLARDSYTLAKLYIRVVTNTTIGASTCRSRKNAGNGNQSVSIPAGTTGVFEDIIHSDSLVSGDLFCSQIIVPDHAVRPSIIRYTLTASTNVPILCTTLAYLTLSANTTVYTNIGGGLTSNTVESSAKYIFRVASTLSNFRVYLYYNGFAGSTTARTRKNGANGAQSVSIAGGATGGFEDAINTDSIIAGDNVNYQIIVPVDGGMVSYFLLMQLKSSSSGRQTVVGDAATTAIAFNSIGYVQIEGAMAWNASEANVQATAQASFNGKNMLVRSPQNSVNNGSTVRTRKNTGNGNLSVSIPASTTGAFEDTVNTDSFVAADLLNWQVVTGGASGNLFLSIIAFELQQPAAPPAGAFWLHPAKVVLTR